MIAIGDLDADPVPDLVVAISQSDYVTALLNQSRPRTADMNRDGSFGGADIDPFFRALGDPAAYAAQFPNCDILNGDMNGDGQFNGADIDPFFACLGGGACP